MTLMNADNSNETRVICSTTMNGAPVSDPARSQGDGWRQVGGRRSSSVFPMPLLRSLNFSTAGYFYKHAAANGAMAPAANCGISELVSMPFRNSPEQKSAEAPENRQFCNPEGIVSFS